MNRFSHRWQGKNSCNVAPSALLVLIDMIHGLTAVAIQSRPCGPQCRTFGAHLFLIDLIHGLTAVAIQCRP